MMSLERPGKKSRDEDEEGDGGTSVPVAEAGDEPEYPEPNSDAPLDEDDPVDP